MISRIESCRIAVFALFAFALYAQSVTGEYVFDDVFLIRDNPTLESVSQFISYFTSGGKEFNRPIRLASFYVDTALFGKNTIAYHLSNIVYYVVFCLLAYVFTQRLFHSPRLSLLVTLLFIAHPLHTEGVAYISGRKDVLGGTFCFASLIVFVDYLREGRRKDLLLSVLFFLLALGTKEIYAVLPVLFLAVEWYRGEKATKHKALHVAFLAGALVFVVYIMFYRNRIQFDYLHVIPVYGDLKGMNFSTAVKICAYIFGLAFFPFFLSADYTYNAFKRIDLLNPQFFVSALTLMACALVLYALRHRQREVSFGLLWMFVLLLPVCQIVPYPEIISERSLILLSFGACVIGAALIARLPTKVMVPVLASVLALFSSVTFERNKVWHDEFSLWSATARDEPDCARARYNFGIALARRGRLADAEREFLASLAINPPELVTVPDYSLSALLNLGNTYALRGQLRQASECYRSVLRYDPSSQLASNNLALIGKMEGNVTENDRHDASDP